MSDGHGNDNVDWGKDRKYLGTTSQIEDYDTRPRLDSFRGVRFDWPQ